MVGDRILRFTRTDEEGSSVLVQVTPSSSKAKRPLDLKLVGTDGLAPYVASLRHDKVEELMVKNCPCTPAEWTAVLTALLNQELTEDIEAVASVRDDSITLVIRKRVKGITQRLGSIDLVHKPAEEIGLFEWCDTAVRTTIETKDALARATAKAKQLEKSVELLKTQLEELVQAKKDDEADLLQKFRDLLNEKKVKIREQQRILASAYVDAIKLEDAEAPQSSGKGHMAVGSRATKRKAAPEIPGEDSSDDDYEKMDTDAAIDPAAEESDQQQTTEEENDETASEDDEIAKPAGKTTSLRTEGPSVNSSRGRVPPNPENLQQGAGKDEVPPARALPFGRKKAGQAPRRAPQPAASDTESDDEL